MRLFIAVDIDKKMQEDVGILQNRVRTKARLDKSDATWVKPEHMHLTLKFLGEIEDECAPEIIRITDEVAASHKPFSIEVERVGTFGRPAKVVWVGIGEKSYQLKALQKDLEERLAAAGWPKEERGFTGHLTLCRIKSFKAGRIVGDITPHYANEQLGSQNVDALYVYKSQLTPEGPVYTLLHKAQLS
jgi:RNA 2',3'-cyclic 3'-phosphodiesterase